MMMKIRCVVIDDEPLALRQLVDYVNRVPFLELIAACSSVVEALELMDDKTVDAVFCDINMPDLNGVDFVKSFVNDLTPKSWTD